MKGPVITGVWPMFDVCLTVECYDLPASSDFHREGPLKRANLLSGLVAFALVAAPSPTQGQLTSFSNTNFGLIADQLETLEVLNPNSTLIDQFYYNLRAAFDWATPVLQRNYVYQVRISGRGGIGTQLNFFWSCS